MITHHTPPRLSHPVALDAQMHEALRGLRKHATDGCRQAKALLHDALEGGADPNAPNEKGITPLMFLATDPRASDGNGNCETFDAAAILLCEYGADPTLDGCTFFSRGARPERIRKSMLAIAKRQRRLGGDTDCHHPPLLVLAMRCPNQLASIIKTVDIPADLPTEWLMVRDQDRNSLLHLLWAAIIDGRQRNPNLDTSDVTRKLVDLGVKLDEPNADGRTVASMILQTVDAGVVNVDADLLTHVMAMDEAQRLEANTRMASGRHLARGRL